MVRLKVDGMGDKLAICSKGCPFYLNWNYVDLCKLFVPEEILHDPFYYPSANLNGPCLRGVSEYSLEKYVKSIEKSDDKN